MNPIVFAMRRPVTTLMLVVAIVSGGVLGLADHRPPDEQSHQRKIVVTSPKAMDVIITQQYVCQIHAQHHINVRALENGYLEEISVKEGQAVKKGDSMFKIVPGAKAELKVDREHQSTFRRHRRPPARAEAAWSRKGDILTTLSDNSVMWVYFNVPEARYLEYMADLSQHKED